MNDKYWEALAERWEALREKGLVWWVDGMWDDEGWAVVWADKAKERSGLALADASCHDGIGTIDTAWIYTKPDLQHPATVGVLLSQWREACGDPGATTKLHKRPDGGWWDTLHFNAAEQRYVAGLPCKTEPEAIIAALEALEPPK